MKSISHKESAKTKNNTIEESNTENLEKDGDDEPKRDKQHWKIIQDTIL